MTIRYYIIPGIPPPADSSLISIKAHSVVKIIPASDDPFGSSFDTTYVYGPIFGASYYAGLRFRIK